MAPKKNASKKAKKKTEPKKTGKVKSMEKGFGGMEIIDVEKTGHKENANVLALLGYFFSWFGGLVVLLMEKDDDFVKFSAMQSIILFVVWMVAWVVSLLLTMVLIGFLLVPVVFLVFLCLEVYLMVQSYSWKMVRLPYIAEYADQYKDVLAKK